MKAFRRIFSIFMVLILLLLPLASCDTPSTEGDTTIINDATDETTTIIEEENNPLAISPPLTEDSVPRNAPAGTLINLLKERRLLLQFPCSLIWIQHRICLQPQDLLCQEVRCSIKLSDTLSTTAIMIFSRSMKRCLSSINSC